MNILCYVRPWSAKQFSEICRSVFKNDDIFYVSDFFGVGTESFQELFYENLRNRNSSGQAYLISEEFDDVRQRCRLLRSVDASLAQSFVDAAYLSFEHIIRSKKIDFVFTKTVDSYIIDVLRIVCKTKKIPFLGICPVFIDGYFRVTERGEHIYLREPSKEEVDSVCQKLLSDDYVPSYLDRPNDRFQMQLKVINNQFKNLLRIPFFRAKRWVKSDPFNYHYWSSEVVSSQKLSWNQALPNFCGEWKSIAKNVQPNCTKIFIPMQYFPEATVDYWCEDIQLTDYFQALLKVIQDLSRVKDILMLVKEHPGALGNRPHILYNKIIENKEVIFIPPNIPSNDVLEVSDIVVVWTGTAGFEAALRGKSVIALGNPYYQFGENFIQNSKIENLEDCIHMARKRNTEQSSDVIKSMVKHVLSNCLPGHFNDDYSFKSRLSNHQNERKIFFDSLRWLVYERLIGSEKPKNGIEFFRTEY